MRKELLVYVSTTEANEEISVTSVAKNRAFVLLNTSAGKFTANRADLVSALQAIEEFDKANNTSTILERSSTNLVDGNVQTETIDVEYGVE